MSTNPLVSPKFRAFDSNGDPLAGGLLYSYAAGTSTPLATYTTRAGSVANANPVVLDANGEANVWTTPGVDYKFELRNSSGVVQWTVDNYPSPAATDTTFDVATDPGGRLTLTTAVPVTTADVTGATTIYYTPHKHNRIPIWNGSEWVLETFAELSQTTTDTTKSPAAVANNSNYDLFVWNDSGTIRISRGPLWTSDTGRGIGAGTTEITRLNGRYVNAVSITNGPAASRGTYVGTVRSNASAQLNDSKAKRHVWNMYHRVLRFMRVEPGTSWTYSTAVLRQANAGGAGAGTYQLDVVVGLNEDSVKASVLTQFKATTSVGQTATVGIGLDSTSSHATDSTRAIGRGQINAVDEPLQAHWVGFVGLGRHYLAWLELPVTGAGVDTFTWNAMSGNPGCIFGEIPA